MRSGGLLDAGCPLIRLTAPSIKDAENLRNIRDEMAASGMRVPLVADIHFTPNAALVAAEIVEKVRINPGNYADRKKFQVFEISDEAYAAELERIRERFLPLVRALAGHRRALHIGTNHGSLSDRIMNRYGDTPEGMVESALEFVRICRNEGFHDIVLSMKSSIPSVMIAAYRHLVRQMVEEGMDYPIHLGVTEAGNGLEGRVKSAIGIGSLLTSGIGDTIRVSLTEDAEFEVPAARQILGAVRNDVGEMVGGAADAFLAELSPTHPSRRPAAPFRLGSLALGGEHPVGVGAATSIAGFESELPQILERHGSNEGPEFLSLRAGAADLPSLAEQLEAVRALMRKESAAGAELPLLLDLSEAELGTLAEFDPNERVKWLSQIDGLILTAPSPADPSDLHVLGDALLEALAKQTTQLIWHLPTIEAEPQAELAAALWRRSATCGLVHLGFVCGPGPHWVKRVRALAEVFDGAGADGGQPSRLRPWVHLEVPGYGPAPAVLAGSVLADGIGDSLVLVGELEMARRAALEEAAGEVWRTTWALERWHPGGVPIEEDPVATAYTLLQACRLRLTRAEFIACPSCGRTQFDLQTTTARIRRRTEHLKGVKIAIMGCIVNGPGEMADADFGYVGSGPKKIDLYVGKERVAKSIHQDEAEDRLVALIREHGRWVDP